MNIREKFETYRDNTDANLKKIADTLDEIVAATTNQSRKTITGRLSKVVVAKLAGAGTMSGIGALISALGTASTGTAIGSLSGAAATSAQLYWLGSVIGLGATGGFFVLGGLGLIGGLAAVLGIKKLKGSAKSLNDLQEAEKELLVKCSKASTVIRLILDKNSEIPADDVG